MANDYNILADYIVSRYIERIAGDDIEETFVDESPADRVMVGMLAENRMEEKFDGGYIENNNTRFESVPSICTTSPKFFLRNTTPSIREYIVPV